jgi:hypothetical protein
MWTRYMPRYHRVSGWQAVSGARKDLNRIDSCFIDASRTMFDFRWEYLHLDSEALSGARVNKGMLSTGPFHFKVLILPSVNTLPADAWHRLLEFAESGGRLVFLEETPLNSDLRFPDPEVRDAFEGLIAGASGVVFLEEWTSKELNALLENWLDKPLLLGDENLDVGLAHKQVKGRDVFFLLNDSGKEIHTSLTFRKNRKMQEWDPATGEITTFDNGRQLNLKPYHGKLFLSLPAS